MNKAQKLDLFKIFIDNGRDKEYIISTLQISKSTYHNYLNEHYNESQADSRCSGLSLKNYYKEVRNGFETKEELAWRLGVSKKTLIKYENEEFLQPIIAMHYAMGWTNQHIARLLHLRHQTVEEFIVGMHTFEEVADMLNIVIEQISGTVKLDSKFKEKISRLKKISKEIALFEL